MTKSMDWFGAVVLALVLCVLGPALDGELNKKDGHDHDEQTVFDGRGAAPTAGQGQGASGASGAARLCLDAPLDRNRHASE